jgi:hypothetical protein
MKQFFLPFLILLPTIKILAQEKMETDRPDQTESPFLTPKKWMQFEIGFNSQKNTASSKEYFYPTLLSKYGISKWFELRLITTVQQTTTAFPNFIDKEIKKGLLPVELGGKIAFCEEKKWLPKTSLIFHFALPKLASKNFKANTLAPNFRFVMQNTLSKNVGLGYNIGAEWDGFTNKPTYIYTFAPGFNLSDKWYAYIEAFGFITKDDAPQHSFDGGLAYYINNNFKIDISGGPGLTKNAPQRYIAIGASYRFKTSQ